MASTSGSEPINSPVLTEFLSGMKTRPSFKIKSKSNWETATPEQRQKIIDNVVEAAKVLQNSVADRRIKEDIRKITQS